MSKPKFLFHIFTSSGTPIYRQLMDQANTLVASGRLRLGDFLPTVRQTAEELEINPMTVSKAYSLLEREGVLENCKGRGMRVISSVKSGGDLKNRKEAMIPVLQEVVFRASQLSLQKDDVVESLHQIWKERRS